MALQGVVDGYPGRLETRQLRSREEACATAGGMAVVAVAQDSMDATKLGI